MFSSLHQKVSMGEKTLAAYLRIFWGERGVMGCDGGGGNSATYNTKEQLRRRKNPPTPNGYQPPS